MPVTPSGIEPATFRFVAQHLNHCATAVPSNGKVGLRPLAFWDCRFESLRRNGSSSLMIVVWCQVKVSESSWSLVQRSPTDSGAPLLVIQKLQERGDQWPAWGRSATQTQKIHNLTIYKIQSGFLQLQFNKGQITEFWFCVLLYFRPSLPFFFFFFFFFFFLLLLTY